MKKVNILLLVFIFAMPLASLAHTTLSTSTPAIDEVVLQPLKEVALNFGTIIETGSTMTLDNDGTTYKFAEINISDEVLTGSLEEELPNGMYTIRWIIIGADGHPIEGQIPFELDVKAEPMVEKEPTDEIELAIDGNEAAQTREAAEAEARNPWISILIGVVLFGVLFAAYKFWKKN